MLPGGVWGVVVPMVGEWSWAVGVVDAVLRESVRGVVVSVGDEAS
ncbi:hypothetical protein [Streptomyces sp. NPDC059787]